MAKKMNFDEIDIAAEDVEFTINGKDYKVTDFSPAMFEGLRKIEEEAQERKANLGDIHAKQLALLTGAPESDFYAVNDIRLTAAMIKYVLDSINNIAEAMTPSKKQKR